MLDNIKHFIAKELPCISFEEYFTKYVMITQDQSISYELDYLKRHNLLNPERLGNAVDDIYKGLLLQ